ncbi:hypothetical protein DMC25_02715, partial [Caulobacter sp. D4A]
MTAIAASLPLPTPASGAAGVSDASSAGDVFGALLAASGDEGGSDQAEARPTGKSQAKPATKAASDRKASDRKDGEDASAGQDAAAAQVGAAVVAAMTVQQQPAKPAQGDDATAAAAASTEAAAQSTAQSAAQAADAGEGLLAKAADLV